MLCFKQSNHHFLIAERLSKSEYISIYLDHLLDHNLSTFVTCEMSTFKGLFDEEQLVHIAADFFEPSVHHCSAFFLSHAHLDHMNGLNASFGELLKQNPDKKMYCSLITKEFFSKMEKSHGFDLDTLIVLDIGVPHLLTVQDQFVTVTLIPAGHCPGSVMFLFEVDDICVLFTGDFRYDAKDISKLKLLKNPNGVVKKINNIYLDTTFAFEEYKDFPSRDQSLQAILTEIKRWFKVDENNIVNLDLPARFAYEFVFVLIHELLNIKVHVPSTKIEFYKNISDIIGSVTRDPNSRIHACPNKANCVKAVSKQTLIIRLSTMLFKDSFVLNLGGGLYKNCDASKINIFYATHSSLNELRTFVNYLSPLKITPFVIPDGYNVNLEILTKRILNLPDVASNSSKCCNSKDSTEQSLKKKPKLKFNENDLHVKIRSGVHNIMPSSSTCINSDQLLMKYINPSTKFSGLNLESPPSSPDN